MKKKLLMAIILGLTVLFVGCGNSMTKKSIEQSKTFMQSREYDKAIISLEMALDEDKENEEANKLYKIINSYQKANKALAENNIEEAKKILDSMDDEYLSYSIKDDINSLKKDVENYDSEVQKVNTYLTESESLFNDNKYRECKKFLMNNILGSEADGIEANKYSTEEQNKKASDMIDKCDKAISDQESKKLAEKEKIEEQRKKEEEKKKEKKSNSFTPEQAISYVVNIYGPAETRMEYKIGSEGLKNKNGKNYYEVYYSVVGSPNYPGADYYGYNVFEDGTVIKFLDNLNYR
ncbi:tetratricopeptide repeat protein [Clostridium perfringens]